MSRSLQLQLTDLREFLNSLRSDVAVFARDDRNVDLVNKGESAALGAGAVYVGGHTLRSGLPRALGVRLETHSTSNQNAKSILKNGGYLDPGKSGTAATRGLEAGQGRVGVTNIDDAKGKVYVTGVRPDSIPRVRTSPFNANRVMRVDSRNQNILHQLIERKLRRQSYRSQSYLNWDKINSAGDYKQVQAAKNKARAREMLKAQLMPWRGRSLYIGGSDNFFMKNFKPDFDDSGAQYSDKKVKVFGNRLAAVKDAIGREGLLNLMRANKSRVAAGVAILGTGGLATALTANAAVDNLSDGNVRGYKRRTKTGKIIAVRGFRRELTNV